MVCSQVWIRQHPDRWVAKIWSTHVLSVGTSRRNVARSDVRVYDVVTGEGDFRFASKRKDSAASWPLSASIIVEDLIHTCSIRWYFPAYRCTFWRTCVRSGNNWSWLTNNWCQKNISIFFKYVSTIIPITMPHVVCQVVARDVSPFIIFVFLKPVMHVSASSLLLQPLSKCNIFSSLLLLTCMIGKSKVVSRILNKQREQKKIH